MVLLRKGHRYLRRDKSVVTLSRWRRLTKVEKEIGYKFVTSDGLDLYSDSGLFLQGSNGPDDRDLMMELNGVSVFRYGKLSLIFAILAVICGYVLLVTPHAPMPFVPRVIWIVTIYITAMVSAYCAGMAWLTREKQL